MRNEKGQFIGPDKDGGFQKGHGRLRTEESYIKAGKKLSESLKKVYKEGRGHFFKKGNPIRSKSGNRYWLGKKRSEDTRKKISKSLEGKNTKENHWNWQNGKSFEIYPEDWTDSLKESIRERDRYVCQECGIHQDELEEKLHVHHIDYDKKNLDPQNLISLCRSCHMKTNANREYWTKHMFDIINNVK